MNFDTLAPGLFVVRYPTAANLAPEAQTGLIDAVERALEAGPVAIVFDVGKDVHMVELSVPSFWLDATDRLPLRAMSIIARSVAVRIAAGGFKLAQTMRRQPIAVEVHQTEAEALSWARAQLSR